MPFQDTMNTMSGKLNIFNPLKMTRIFPLLALCLALVACNNSEPRTQTAAPKALASSAGAAVTCPSQDFNVFVKAFANDVRIQKAFVADPLQDDSVDASAEPEPKLVTNMLTASQLHFPLMYDDQRQMHDGLKAEQTILNANEIRVTLFKEDTDYEINFFFKKTSDCWQLYHILDASL